MPRFTALPAAAVSFAMIASLTASAGGAAAQATASAPTAQSETAAERYRNTKEWDLNKRDLAIDGYDPVAYFAEGGGKATKGKERFEYRYKNVVYRFANARNRDLFRLAPDRYEPQYGGWCAWAMSKGTKTEINPKSFIVKGDKLFLFYDGLFGDTKKDWQKGSHPTLVRSADGEWREISGEEPHSAPDPTKPAEPESGSGAG